MRYLVKKFKVFGKFDAEIWVDDIEETAEKIIWTPRGISVQPLSKKTAKRCIALIRSGKIKPLYESVTDLDL